MLSLYVGRMVGLVDWTIGVGDDVSGVVSEVEVDVTWACAGELPH